LHDVSRVSGTHRLEAQLAEDHAAAEFEQALEDILDRLDRLINE
jgi:TetR/AcrR family tetracycline transcriptional repressor